MFSIYEERPIHFISSNGVGITPQDMKKVFAHADLDRMYLHQNGDITYALRTADGAKTYRMVNLTYELPVDDGVGWVRTVNCIASGDLRLEQGDSSTLLGGTVTVVEPTERARFFAKGNMEFQGETVTWVIAAEYRPEYGWRESTEVLLLDDAQIGIWLA